MINYIANKYFEWRYGKVYLPKPPLGPYNNWYKKLSVHIWFFDCWVDKKYRSEAKAHWMKVFEGVRKVK